MDKAENQSESKWGDQGALSTYLHDHTAGAQHAIELLRALSEAHAGGPLGETADELLQQVTQDLAVLERIATKVGAQDFQVKELAGWIADKFSRLKLAPLGNAFHAFEALEFLSLGILGKRALWKALSAIATEHVELRDIDLERLIVRAEAQYEATEGMRLRMVAEAFGGHHRS